MRKLPTRDPLAKCHREAVAERSLGTHTECVRCGEVRILALERKSKPTICTECRKELEGTTIMEQHHIAGEANGDLTISVFVNDHRAQLSENQADWPAETLQNPDGSPLLMAAACIRGFIDTVIYLIEELLLWGAALLEGLNAHLTEKLGPRWWVGTKIEKFGRKRGRENA